MEAQVTILVVSYNADFLKILTHSAMSGPKMSHHSLWQFQTGEQNKYKVSLIGYNVRKN